MTTNLFAYGILMHEEIVHRLTGQRIRLCPAILENHQRYKLEREGWSELAVVVPEAGSSVPGFMLLDVDDESMLVLDAFEDAGIGLYQRATRPVMVDNGTRLAAQVYTGTPETIPFLTDVWNESVFVATYYREYLEEVVPQFLRELKARPGGV